MGFLTSTYPNQFQEDLGETLYPYKHDINFGQGSTSAPNSACRVFMGDHETYIVFMAKIYSLQRLPSYALHKMFWYPNKNKKRHKHIPQCSSGIRLQGREAKASQAAAARSPGRHVVTLGTKQSFCEHQVEGTHAPQGCGFLETTGQQEAQESMMTLEKVHGKMQLKLKFIWCIKFPFKNCS